MTFTIPTALLPHVATALLAYLTLVGPYLDEATHTDLRHLYERVLREHVMVDHQAGVGVSR